MKRTTLLLLFLILLLWYVGSLVWRGAAPIGSLYYQPLVKDEGKIVWDEVFSTMKQCHVQQLILQWSRHGVVDFIAQEGWLERILTSAKKYNINVVIGLYSDSNYFKVIENPDGNLTDYFQGLLQHNREQAQRVYRIAKVYDNFSGWYLSEEIDDMHFQTNNRQAVLKHYLTEMALSLKAISPQPLYLSGFYSNQIMPEAYAVMFEDITQGNYRVLLQSGMGAKLVDAAESEAYIRHFSDHFQEKLIPIVEAFVIEDTNISVMDFESFNRQIELVQSSADNAEISLFSLRYFLHPTLIEAYRQRYCY